ncbi:hypothetical protein [Paenibacillus cucumis (ex Kampfer et al. 2016)]|uniref:Uncharacterized protein n=1 Tax=Paenibacillus cucumis (ex Kampfer et al. 2016) TaxID=1776858 RepID=A0ABS7KPI6_9BACL|nr:hypothetical protein [Paenibacillus cucumis (ex Kampfer et al. 2016)]MBY0206023.1 hypothetical protein [Paenibacillus cucumis (ex Kampfer et al. 2016)]
MTEQPFESLLYPDFSIIKIELKMVYTDHYEDRITFQSLLSPDFLDSLFSKGKSGDKGDRFAFSGFFCLLRFCVTYCSTMTYRKKSGDKRVLRSSSFSILFVDV